LSSRENNGHWNDPFHTICQVKLAAVPIKNPIWVRFAEQGQDQRAGSVFF